MTLRSQRTLKTLISHDCVVFDLTTPHAYAVHLLPVVLAGAVRSGHCLPVQVVEENMRHLCAFKVASAAHIPARWWKFASLFASQCTMRAGAFNETCAAAQLQVAGIDVCAVRACMGNTTTEDKPHAILEVRPAVPCYQQRVAW